MAEFAPFTEATTYVVDAYATAGVQAASSLADLLTPGVLVLPESIGEASVDGSTVTVGLTLFLVAAGHDAHAVASLDQLLDAGRQLGLVGPSCQAVSLVSPNHNAGGLPALETTIHLTVRNET